MTPDQREDLKYKAVWVVAIVLGLAFWACLGWAVWTFLSQTAG
jgi:hypothetical protein